jgi:hypothetical protein
MTRDRTKDEDWDGLDEEPDFLRAGPGEYDNVEDDPAYDEEEEDTPWDNEDEINEPHPLPDYES